MKLLLVAVAAAVILLTGITIWVGARTREPTVVAHPYEEGLDLTRRQPAADTRPQPAAGGALRLPGESAGHDHAHLAAHRDAASDGAAPGAAPPGRAPDATPPCDLGAGACTAALDDLALEVELGPRPLAALRELTVEARVRAGGAPGAPLDGAELELLFSMPGMAMGENRVRLTAAGEGRYRGKAVLVRCHSGRRDWVADVAVRHAGHERRARFAVQLGE